MTFFPQNPHQRPASAPAAVLAPIRPAQMHDILWNRPVFRAPALSNPRIAPDPLPFTANRLTQPALRD
jgi:hypothetical protein